MTIKPKRSEIDAFANKANVNSETRDDWILISLRLPPDILNELDESRKEQGWVSRNSWIVNSIQERLRKNYDPN